MWVLLLILFVCLLQFYVAQASLQFTKKLNMTLICQTACPFLLFKDYKNGILIWLYIIAFLLRRGSYMYKMCLGYIYSPLSPSYSLQNSPPYVTSSFQLYSILSVSPMYSPSSSSPFSPSFSLFFICTSESVVQICT